MTERLNTPRRRLYSAALFCSVVLGLLRSLFMLFLHGAAQDRPRAVLRKCPRASSAFGAIMNVTLCVFRKRAPYIAYLTRCRQGLQTAQAHLERLLQRVLKDKEVANRYFTTVCVRLLLEHMESKMLEFIKGIFTFQQRDDLTQTEQFLHK